jgi:hypothetical protein
MRNARPIPRADIDHINSLHKWAAQAAARGDMETSERFQNAAHLVLDRAAAAQMQEPKG